MPRKEFRTAAELGRQLQRKTRNTKMIMAVSKPTEFPKVVATYTDLKSAWELQAKLRKHRIASVIRKDKTDILYVYVRASDAHHASFVVFEHNLREVSI